MSLYAVSLLAAALTAALGLTIFRHEDARDLARVAYFRWPYVTVLVFLGVLVVLLLAGAAGRVPGLVYQKLGIGLLGAAAVLPALPVTLAAFPLDRHAKRTLARRISALLSGAALPSFVYWTLVDWATALFLAGAIMVSLILAMCILTWDLSRKESR